MRQKATPFANRNPNGGWKGDGPLQSVSYGKDLLEHEHILENVQQWLDENPEKMRQRHETVEHPFGTIKCWMGYTHFQMKTMKRVGSLPL